MESPGSVAYDYIFKWCHGNDKNGLFVCSEADEEPLD